MAYMLKNCRTGEAAVYPTFLDVEETQNCFCFRFTAYRSEYFCPYGGYNEAHYMGDVCEVFLEISPNCYYEMELTPQGALFLAKITYLGLDEAGKVRLETEFVPEANCFVKTCAQIIPGGYRAEFSVEKAPLGPGPFRFNAFRIDTDGGETDKHLFALNPTLQPRFHVPKAFVPLNTDYQGESAMNYLNVSYTMKHSPKLDPEFIPFGVWMDAYLAKATQPIAIAVERNDGQVSVRHAKIYGTADMEQADYRFVERYMKFLLWSIGGFKVSVCGCSSIAKKLQAAYVPGGEREFDADFFQKLYERPLEILDLPLESCPEANEVPKPIGGHLDGCRIGFDAGGSDRKVSAVIDGECVYSEEVVWLPKVNPDPNYQYEGILDSFRTAASKMPRVDGIGVSSAGVFIGNAPMISSIFYCVPRERWDEVKTVFDRAAAEIGNVPIVVANDGDVSALAGAMGMGCGCLMGLAMGTSEAVGYVDADKNVLGWISELAFAPVDLNENAMQDEWSTDFGVGCKYFSQDAVIKLAPRAGIELDPSLTPAEKLKVVQKLMEADDPRAQAVFYDIGVYLAYAVVQYSHFYDLKHLMLLGRVMSGKGGDIILATCNAVLADEFPAIAAQVQVMLPDEKTRRVGQSAAAASLPRIS